MGSRSYFTFGNKSRRSSAAKRRKSLQIRNRRRLLVERLESRTLLTVAILNGGGLGYAGDANGALQPPDTCGAAGPSCYIESTNNNFKIYTPKANGTTVVTKDPTDFFFGTAITDGNLTPLDTGSGEHEIGDVTMVYDNLMGGTGRFILGNIDVDTVLNVSQYVFAVSKSNDPTTLTPADWTFYQVTTTEGSGGANFQSWSDYPGNPGFNADAFVETFNMFGNGPTGCQVISFNAADLAAGDPLVTSGAGQDVFHSDVPGGAQQYRPVTMQDSVPGDPMWLIHNPETGTTINVVKMTGVLSNSPSFATGPSNVLTLPPSADFVGSGGIGNPLNPNNVSAIDGDDESAVFAPTTPAVLGRLTPATEF